MTARQANDKANSNRGERDTVQSDITVYIWAGFKIGAFDSGAPLSPVDVYGSHMCGNVDRSSLVTL